ncbi:MAG: DUF5565 family protein [Dehalococcoidia bacterium]|nr:DUF5565 family protein [Dehalococcoidia bacterium]
MKKIISLFCRNYDGDRLIRDEIVEGAEWVIIGEGIATVKVDGTCCLVRDGKLYKRYDAKKGRKPPANFEAAQDYDEITGHMPGWVPVGDGPEDKWHREAFNRCTSLDNGTYELIGPKIQGNPYAISDHHLIRHGSQRLTDVPTQFDQIRVYLIERPDIEGIVWWHPDGRMVKVKRKDYGLSWPPRLIEGA